MSNKFREKALMYLETAANMVVKATDGIQNTAARAVVRGASSAGLVGAGLKTVSEAYNDGAAAIEPIISQSQGWQDVLLSIGGIAVGLIGARTGKAALNDFREYRDGLVERKATPGAADLRNQGPLPTNTYRNA